MIDIPVVDVARKHKINARNKGKVAEREVRDILQPIVDSVFNQRGYVPPQLKRNLMQAAGGGHDLVGIPGVAIEVKRQETLHVGMWWQQALEQAAKENAVPVLIYRKSWTPWKVRMNAKLHSGKVPIDVVADLELEKFLVWLRLHLEAILDEGISSEKNFKKVLPKEVDGSII